MTSALQTLRTISLAVATLVLVCCGAATWIINSQAQNQRQIIGTLQQQRADEKAVNLDIAKLQVAIKSREDRIRGFCAKTPIDVALIRTALLFAPNIRTSLTGNNGVAPAMRPSVQQAQNAVNGQAAVQNGINAANGTNAPATTVLKNANIETASIGINATGPWPLIRKRISDLPHSPGILAGEITQLIRTSETQQVATQQNGDTTPQTETNTVIATLTLSAGRIDDATCKNLNAYVAMTPKAAPASSPRLSRGHLSVTHAIAHGGHAR